MVADTVRVSKPFTFREKPNPSDINNDVLFDVFLHFVAIDLDGGPFTLTRVCT